MGGVPKRVHPENHGFILQDDYMGGVPKRVHPENHSFTTKCGQTWKKNGVSSILSYTCPSISNDSYTYHNPLINPLTPPLRLECRVPSP